MRGRVVGYGSLSHILLKKKSFASIKDRIRIQAIPNIQYVIVNSELSKLFRASVSFHKGPAFVSRVART